MTKKEYVKYLHSDRWRSLRWSLWWIQQERCNICGAVVPLDRFVVHHNSYTRLGAERPEDLVGVCKRCNYRLHDIWRNNHAVKDIASGQQELEAFGVSA